MFPSNPLVPPKNHSKQLSFTMALKLLASLPIYNFSRVLVSSKDPISLVTSRTEMATFLVLSNACPPTKFQIVLIFCGDQQITNLPFGTMITLSP